MYKLSKIELDNFRVFKGHKTFKFLNRTDEPYNFICIYGPNGSGKTSLVDALEWLATGKLHRFDSDMQVQGKNYKGSILTNLEAYSNNQWAKVTAHFIDSNRDSLKYRRSVRPRRDSANDYLSGSCNGRGLSPMQILPYSKIAGFVSAEKPEQRFNSWAGFIDPEDQSFSLMINTYRLRSKIKSVLDNTEDELEKINTDLMGSNLDAELVSALNNAILSYNEAYRTILPQEKTIVPIRQNESGIYQIPDLSAIKSLQLRVADELERLRTREPILKQLIDGYPDYQKAVHKLAAISKLENVYKEKIVNIQQRRDFDNLTRSLNSLYDALTHTLNECIDDIKEQIGQSTAQKNNFEKEQQIWRQQFEQIEQATADLKAIDPKPAYQDAIERQKMLKSGLWSLSQISNSIKARNFEVASTHAATLPEKYRQKVIEKIRELVEKDGAIQRTSEQLAQIYQRIQEAESSCNEVIASIEQIRAQIINAQLNACPVCQTEFASTESLLARIKQEFYSKDLAEARVEYHDKDVLLKSFRDSYQSLVQSWNLIEQNTRNDLEEELSAQNKVVKEISVKVEQFNRSISLLEDRRQTFKKQLNTKMDFTGELTKDTFESLVKNTYQRLCECVLQKESMLYQLSTLSERLHTVTLFSFGETSDERQFLETSLHLLPTQPEKFNNLKASIQKYITKIDKLSAKREILPDLSEANPEKLSSYKTRVSKLVRQRSTLETVIDAYQKLHRDAQFFQQTNIEQVRQQFYNEYRMKSILDTKISPSLIDILSHETELLAYHKKYQNLMKQKDELQNKVEVAEQAFEKIDTLYTSMCSLQQKMVDQAFSGEMVNQLYCLLEPNKDFPRLSFKIDFNSAERPELYIKAHESGADDSLVLPELIFSTAQLNTISLCIFLSNALSNPQLESQTLILDDPISCFDDINTVAFSDLLRILCVQNDWQIIFTTHDEKLFRLLQVKLSPMYHNSLFMQFKDKGQLDVRHKI